MFSQLAPYYAVTVLFCLPCCGLAAKGMQVLHNILAGYKSMQAKLHLHSPPTHTVKVDSLSLLKVYVFHSSSALEDIGILKPI